MTDNSSAGAYIKHKDYLLVQVQEDAKHIHVNTYDNDLVYSIMEGWRGIDLPPGTWQLIGLAAGVTEGQWREIVELRSIPGFGNGYRDYEAHAEGDTVLHGRADTSGQSLLRSHNLNENKTVILKLTQ